MKIGIVCFPTYGGSGVLATELGIALSKKGHQVHFITYQKPVRLQSFYNNIFFHEVSSFQYPLFDYIPYETSLASKMIDVAKFEKLDILHVHYAIPHASAAFMAKKVLASEGIHIPVVTTLHGTDITLVGIDRSFKPVIEFCINNSDGVTAVSQSLKKDTIEKFNITTDINVIYNFIDTEKFKRKDHRGFRKILAPNNEKVIIHTSNFRKVKRVEDVIQAFKLINEKIPSKLMLIGDGPERQALEMLCRKLGVCDNIKFLGKQDAIEELLSLGDIFMLPSQHESFGLSALEAMACQVPVVSSNAGGIPEVNIDGETGYICEIGDVEALAANSIKILTNDDLLTQFRANALAKAKSFCINEIVPKYENLYQKLLIEA